MRKQRLLFVIAALPIRVVRMVRDPGKASVTLLGVETHGQTISLGQKESWSEKDIHREMYQEAGQSENGSHAPAAKNEGYRRRRSDVKWNASDKVHEHEAPVVDHLGHTLGDYNESAASDDSTGAGYLVGPPNDKMSGFKVAFVQVWHNFTTESEWKALALWATIVPLLLLSTVVIGCLFYNRSCFNSDDTESNWSNDPTDANDANDANDAKDASASDFSVSDSNPDAKCEPGKLKNVLEKLMTAKPTGMKA